MKSGRSHVFESLPGYVNGTLNWDEEQRVSEHLHDCAECQRELASWQEVSKTVHSVFAYDVEPTEDLMHSVWTRVEAEEKMVSDGVPSLTARLSLAWQILQGQVILVKKGIWLASTLTMIVGCLVALASMNPSAAGTTFAVFAPMVAAFGVAFVYGSENDPSLEIALSTPTKPRLVLLARLTLVYGYDLALALAATGVLVFVKEGTGVWHLVSLWIGPMLFLSALTLLLSLLFGATAAILAAVVLWSMRLAVATYSAPGLYAPKGIQLLDGLWQNNAILLPLAALLLVAAVFCAPYRINLSQGRMVGRCS